MVIYIKRRLKIKKGEKLTLDEYVHRCERLEKRNNNKLPQIALSRGGIDYLADPRGIKVIIYPADLFTRRYCSDLKSVTVFTYQDNYPFYGETKSAELKIMLKNDETNGLYGEDSVLHLMVNNMLMFEKLSSGVYQFNIYVVDKDFKEDKIKEYNAAPLKVSYVRKPVAPIMANQIDPEIIPVNEDKLLIANRNNKQGDLTNLWFLTFNTGHYGRWKSLKYTEETELLMLDQPYPNEILKREQQRTGVKMQLLSDEYPYDTFITKDGDINNRKDLRAFIYPKTVHIYFTCPFSLNGHTDDDLLWSLDLNETEKLIGRKSYNGMKVYFNGVFLVEGYDLVEFWLRFNMEKNAYELYDNRYEGKLYATLKNYINPDISIQDIEIQADILNLYMNYPGKYYAQLVTLNEYVFISNKSHGYSENKRIRLFASSPFQGYFPNVKSEFEIGTAGSSHPIFVPNNTLPEEPVLDTDVLLMHTINNSWNADRKKSATRNLVRITLSQDFMKEGRNILGIVMANLTAIDRSENASLAGDDITKLSGYDHSNKTLKDFLDFTSKSNMFSKYIASEAYKIFSINGIKYEVLQCIPFYNYQIKKWQVVLPFTELQGSEAMFIKLVTLKISSGRNLEPISKGAKVFIDKTGTNLSKFKTSDPLAIYNQKVFVVIREQRTYKIQYKGPMITNKPKLFFVMMVNRNYDLSEILFRNNLQDDLVAIESAEAVSESIASHNILCFSDDTITINRVPCKAILILEFEVHANYRGIIPIQPIFVNKNPLFETEGIRLVNMAEFKA